jgi:hypothetical protein
MTANQLPYHYPNGISSMLLIAGASKVRTSTLKADKDINITRYMGQRMGYPGQFSVQMTRLQLDC